MPEFWRTSIIAFLRFILMNIGRREGLSNIVRTFLLRSIRCVVIIRTTLLLRIIVIIPTGTFAPVALLGSGHWERDSWEREQGKGGWESYCYKNNVVSLQINTAGIMAMNRVDRIVLDSIRTYACTRTARTGVRVTRRL